jgi:alpha-amylase
MRAMRDVITQYPHAYMVCESPSSYQQFAQNSSCGKAFHFSAGHRILESVKAGRVVSGLIPIIEDDNLANMPLILANHDYFAGDRIANQLNYNLTQYRLAAATYILLSANPFTYYGEEIGMAAGSNLQADASLRTPMSWTNDSVTAGFTSGNAPFRRLSANSTTNNVAAQLNDSDSLYAFYQRLYALRQAYPEIATGTKTALSQPNDEIIVWKTQSGDTTVVIALNLRTQTGINHNINVGMTNVSFSNLYDSTNVNTNTLVSDSSGQLLLSLAAHGVQVWIN